MSNKQTKEIVILGVFGIVLWTGQIILALDKDESECPPNTKHGNGLMTNSFVVIMVIIAIVTLMIIVKRNSQLKSTADARQ